MVPSYRKVAAEGRPASGRPAAQRAAQHTEEAATGRTPRVRAWLVTRRTIAEAGTAGESRARGRRRSGARHFLTEEGETRPAVSRGTPADRPRGPSRPRCRR